MPPSRRQDAAGAASARGSIAYAKDTSGAIARRDIMEESVTLTILKNWVLEETCLV
jgi:hypothetical protein